MPAMSIRRMKKVQLPPCKLSQWCLERLWCPGLTCMCYCSEAQGCTEVVYHIGPGVRHLDIFTLMLRSDETDHKALCRSPAL